MKRCPTCQQTYTDETLQFCRLDGALLVDDSSAAESATTLVLPDPHQISEKSTRSIHLPPSIAVLPFVNTLGHACGVSGRTREAQTVLTQLKEMSEQSYVSTYFIATVYLGLGKKDETFEWLNKAYDDREQWLIYLKVEPKLDSLRSDPRFADLVRRVGLTQ